MKNNNTDTIISLKNVSKSYTLYDRNLVDRFKDVFLPGGRKRGKQFQALNNINLEIKRGEILGIVGRNGAGKSTLLKVIAGITKPSSGQVSAKGRIVALLELGGAFNPDYTGRENIYYYCSLIGLSKSEADKITPDVIEFSELGDFIDVPIKKYSSGMRARLGFAVSVNVDPEILILDEILSVGDDLFRRKCFVRMEDFINSGKTILFVSHSAQSIQDICTRAILMYNGEVLFEAHPVLVIKLYNILLFGENQENARERVVQYIINLNKNLAEKERQELIIIDSGNEINEKELESSEISFSEKEEWYDPEYTLKNLKTNRIVELEIYNYLLRNLSGQNINHLKFGQNYRISFDIKFSENVEKVKIGCFIRSENGRDLTGCLLPENQSSLPIVFAGTIFSFAAEFTANFAPGVYIIRFVVRGQHRGSIVPLIQGTDHIIFKVNRPPSTFSHGPVSLFNSASLVKGGDYSEN